MQKTILYIFFQRQFKSSIDINYKILQHYNIKIQHNNILNKIKILHLTQILSKTKDFQEGRNSFNTYHLHITHFDI